MYMVKGVSHVEGALVYVHGRRCGACRSCGVWRRYVSVCGAVGQCVVCTY